MTESPLDRDPQFPRHWVDRRSVPERGEGVCGRWFDISGDQRLPGLFRSYQDDACDHPETVIVKRADSAGRTFYSRFCKFCGVKFSGHLARAKAEADGIANISVEQIAEVAERYIEQRQQHLDRIVAAAVERATEIAEEARDEYKQKYADYLRSPQWKRKAVKIMQRARGICEGCLTLPAEEVHHLTYEHVFEEFAFELAAMCSRCHRRFHGKEMA